MVIVEITWKNGKVEWKKFKNNTEWNKFFKANQKNIQSANPQRID